MSQKELRDYAREQQQRARPERLRIAVERADLQRTRQAEQPARGAPAAPAEPEDPRTR